MTVKEIKQKFKVKYLHEASLIDFRNVQYTLVQSFLCISENLTFALKPFSVCMF